MAKVRRKVFILQFEDPGMAEYEVRVRSISLGKLLALGDQPDRARAGAGLEEVRELINVFCERLQSWNLTDETDEGVDIPVPTTVDGLLELDAGDALAMVIAWLDAITAVTESLGKDLTSGERFPEASIPMAVA